MAKNSRRKQPSRKLHEGARGSQAPARDYPAPSSSWNDMAYRSRSSDLEQSTPWVDRRRKSTPPPVQRPRRGPVPSSHALFGTWELPPPQRAQKKLSEPVSTCQARAERRSVLFATRSTGAGSTAPKKRFTNRSCK